MIFSTYVVHVMSSDSKPEPRTGMARRIVNSPWLILVFLVIGWGPLFIADIVLKHLDKEAFGGMRHGNSCILLLPRCGPNL